MLLVVVVVVVVVDGLVGEASQLNRPSMEYLCFITV